MRKLVPVMVVTAVLLLAGCTSTPSALHEADYLRLARAHVSEVQDWSDAKLDKVGKAACATLKDGGSAGKRGWVEVIKVLTDSGFTGAHAGGFTAFAVSRFCPDLKSYLPAS